MYYENVTVKYIILFNQLIPTSKQGETPFPLVGLEMQFNYRAHEVPFQAPWKDTKRRKGTEEGRVQVERLLST